jgi:S-adenosylmethionine decarboxylase
VTVAAARGGLRSLAERFPTGHFFLAMPKTWPYIQKNRTREFFASERSTERRERVQALGRHLLLELFDCDAEALNSLETVKVSMVEAAKRAQATIIDVVFHEFNPFGISGVVVIAESHLSIHTWPEHRYAAVDIFSCGETLKPAEAANYLVEQFGASRASCVEVKRGVFPGIAGVANRVKEGVAGNGATEPLQMVL